jgi:hypothetical protein
MVPLVIIQNNGRDYKKKCIPKSIPEDHLSEMNLIIKVKKNLRNRDIGKFLVSPAYIINELNN